MQGWVPEPEDVAPGRYTSNQKKAPLAGFKQFQALRCPACPAASSEVWRAVPSWAKGLLLCHACYSELPLLLAGGFRAFDTST